MRKVVLVTLLLVMGCGSSEEGTSLLSQQGPPASGADRAPATTIPKVAPCPDNDVACCEEQLGVESTDCLEVLVELGHCRTVSIPDGSACDSGTVCGVEATCQNGACNVPEEGTDCAALEVGPCALATCNDETGECDIYPLSDGTECGDGDSCNGLDVCLGGSCQSIPSPDCNDGNPCTVDTCAPESGCIQTPAEGESCSDDNVCTQNDTCDAAGLCIPGQPVCPCTEAEDCQGKAGLCDSPLVCINEQCTPDPKTPPVVCNDGNPCTNDACDEATGDCVYTNNENPCTDGNPCTEEDRCEEGSCTGTSKICDDGDPCTTDETCDLATGLCTEGVYSCQSCSDASECPPLPACGGQFECVDEVCKLIEGSALNCSELPTAPCTVNSCDDASGTCKQTSLADGTPCDDGNLCTTFDACSSGACVPGPAEDCDDKNDCTVDACSPDVGCTTTAQSGASCSDNNLCTLADTCLNGE